jgi:3-methyladenine DNA glycosylase AlkD
VGALDDIRRELAAAARPARAAGAARYFQTGPGGYAEGDRFLGVTVPDQRRVVARHWRRTTPEEAVILLQSPLHEERLTALLLLVRRFQRGDQAEQGRLCDLYLQHAHRVDNWDLVDSSAPYLLGPWLLDRDRDRSVLDRLSRSERVWDRRIAVLATAAFIRAGDFAWTFRLARRLLRDPHDLIHKAVGWMLREVGNRDPAAAERFLRRHHRTMPRTMLRYAIEKLPAARRQAYLRGTDRRPAQRTARRRGVR